jgi:threonyl-tRNA synthetase
MVINDKLNKLAGILLAKAIKDLYPDAQLGDLKLMESGFVYTFASEPTVSIKELPKISKLMSKNIDKAYTLTYEVITVSEAKKLFHGQHYKLDLISNMKDKVNIIRFGNDFVDLCENLGIEKLSSVKAFELLNVSGIY